ncbi:MAG TPA: hypothetical protein PLU53_01885 [Bacteroidia bacterium]|nr:hypothetical protein [Bacteroidia bacterium]
MKKVIFYACAFGLCILAGCNEEKKNEANTTATPVESSVNQPENPGVLTDSTQQPAMTQQAELPAGQPAVSAAQNQTATGMNPAHGQPGHRCDIAVGAPLNSPVQQNSTVAPAPLNASPNMSAPQNITIPPVSQGAPQIQTAVPAATPTAPGMNPPHGEPGHDCSIAVGAPLKK